MKRTRLPLMLFAVALLMVSLAIWINTAAAGPVEIPVPMANTGLIYDGTEQTGVDGGTGYLITGNTATAAGSHTATATPDSGYAWVGGSTESQNISWEIARKQIAVPTANSGLIYDGTEQTGVDSGTGYSITGNTATAAGSHTATATPNSDYAWVGGSTASQNIPWEIARQQIAVPTANTGLVFNGDDQIGVDSGTGYSITGNTATVAGPHTATATPNSDYAWVGGSTASQDIPWEIARKQITTPTATLSQEYTGGTLSVIGTGTGYHLTGTSSATNVGTYTASAVLDDKDNTVWSISGNAADIPYNWAITPAPLPPINLIPDQVYTGNHITPAVTFATTMPVTTHDYTLTYGPNVNVRDSAVLVTATASVDGNYKNVQTKTFNIVKAPLPAINAIPDQVYTGNHITPAVTFATSMPVIAADYTLTYGPNVNVRDSAVLVTATASAGGNYQNTQTKTFNIVPRTLPAIAAIPNQIYTGRQLKPAVIMTNEAVGYTLVKDRDFTVAYANSIDGGMINSSNTPPVVTVTGINNYKLSKSVTFTILDNQASVFDEANASHTNGHMYIKVEDNWGLKYVKVTRNNQIIQEQWLNDILNPAYSFNVTFVQPGSYQLYATDLYNNEKVLYDMPLYVGDSDNDGLANGYERSINTDPLNPDTDGDGLSDGEEVLRLGTKPLIADTDGDGMSDMEEQSLGLNPRSSDSDSDGIADKLDVLLRALLSAHDFNSTAAMEILLNTNRGGIQPALDSTRRAKALEDLVIINYLDELLNNFKLELGKNKVLFAPADGLGDPLTMNANDRNAMLFKLNAQDNRFYSMHQGTLLEYRRDDKGNLAIVNALNLALLSDEDGKPAFVYSDESQDNFDTPVVMSDRAGTLFLVGSWSRSQSKVTQDLLLIDPVTYKVYRIPGSAGATHFGVAPTGGKVAYILDGKPVIIDLEAANMFTLDSEARFLNFTEKGDLIIDLKGGKATVVGNDGKESQIDYEGILNVQQPTNNYRSLLFIKDGIETPFSFAASANVDLLLSQIRQRAQVAINGVEPAVPEYNSVRLFDPKDSTSPKIRVSLLKDFAK